MKRRKQQPETQLTESKKELYDIWLTIYEAIDKLEDDVNENLLKENLLAGKRMRRNLKATRTSIKELEVKSRQEDKNVLEERRKKNNYVIYK